jgi:hypothetical protein
MREGAPNPHTHIRCTGFSRMTMKKLEQCSLYHPVTDETQSRLVAYAQKWDDVAVAEITPGNHLVAKRLRNA